MKAMFGLAGLLVVLLIVGSMARKQLESVQAVSPAAAPVQPGAAPTNTMPQQVQQDVQRALEQGAAARASAVGQ